MKKQRGKERRKRKKNFFSEIIFKNIFYLYLQKDFMWFQFSTYVEKGNEK